MMTHDTQMDTLTISVGLEEGPDGATLVHCFTIPGCVAGGATQEQALAAFPAELSRWLDFLEEHGAPVPSPDTELEVAVDEWVQSDARVGAGESTTCFEADLPALTEREIMDGLRTLGDLRGRLLQPLKRVRDPDLDQLHVGEWTLRRVLDELARAQWWTLTRLGASPMAEVPARTLGRLDTAMALVVQQFTGLSAEARGRVIELDDETWTPRKVLRRLLWLEWTLGRSALHALPEPAEL